MVAFYVALHTWLMHWVSIFPRADAANAVHVRCMLKMQFTDTLPDRQRETGASWMSGHSGGMFKQLCASFTVKSEEESSADEEGEDGRMLLESDDERDQSHRGAAAAASRRQVSEADEQAEEEEAL